MHGMPAGTPLACCGQVSSLPMNSRLASLSSSTKRTVSAVSVGKIATVVPPAIQIASSAMKKCAQFFDRMAMRAPGARPSDLQVAGHAPGLVHQLRPGVVDHLAAADRLGQEDVIGPIRLVVVDVVEHGSCVRHVASFAHVRGVRPRRQGIGTRGARLVVNSRSRRPTVA